jgi:hypothetical protein
VVGIIFVIDNRNSACAQGGVDIVSRTCCLWLPVTLFLLIAAVVVFAHNTTFPMIGATRAGSGLTLVCTRAAWAIIARRH